MSTNKITKQYGNIISEFSVPRRNWEMDGTGWIVQTVQGLKLVLTDHGNPYLATVEELHELQKYYLQVHSALLQAEKLLEPSLE